MSVVVGITLLLKPVICGEDPVALHVNKVPATFDVRVIPVAWLLHWLLAGGALERSGLG